jgi:hypothetical protein
MIFFDKICEHFPTSEDLLDPIVVPLLLKKRIYLFDSFVEHHHQLFPALLIMHSILEEIQEFSDLLFDVGNELQLHLILEVEEALVIPPE